MAEENKILTVEDFKKALKKGSENAKELQKQLKSQFGMSNINRNLIFK